MMYLFRLGHQPHVSFAEVIAVFSARSIFFTTVLQNNEYLLISTENEIDCPSLMEQLGGIVWIAEKVKDIAEGESPEEELAIYLDKQVPAGKINYSFRGGDAKHIALEAKTVLKEYKRSARYIEPKNTATIIHNGLLESGTDITFYTSALFATRAVQPIDDFSQRDYGKPGVDSRSGMLPPKLARTMINLSGKNPKYITILDPFCGSGVLLMEAAALECKNIIGSDTSKKAIEDSEKNMDWVKGKLPNANYQVQIFECDAKGIANKVEKETVDVVATEPFMGKPLRGRESKVDLERQARELSLLYIESFGQFKRILKPSGVVIFIIPRFKYKDDWIMVNCLEQIQKMGFKLEPFMKDHESLLYWRKGQHVGREIWRFKKQ